MYNACGAEHFGGWSAKRSGGVPYPFVSQKPFSLGAHNGCNCVYGMLVKILSITLKKEPFSWISKEFYQYNFGIDPHKGVGLFATTKNWINMNDYTLPPICKLIFQDEETTSLFM